jgi:deoxyribodipyrimidine photo-lyase
MHFDLTYPEILERIAKVDPTIYARTRNFLNGDVTYLSPFISRGVISGKQVLETVLAKGHKRYQIEKFIQELAWREYFQRVWQAKGDLIHADLKQTQPDIRHRQMVSAIAEASTGILAIDKGIRNLYETGYMHNHMRMYVASLTCNIAGAHWEQPARWLYYHLLDGDIASNNCSWQWVAGAFSPKKYYCNQENINKYTGSTQRNTFLDLGYDQLPHTTLPETLKESFPLNLQTHVPVRKKPDINTDKPTLVYNSYNLDPLWRKDEEVNRLLLLEPSHFEKYPVGQQVMNFILSMAQQIPGIDIYAGEFAELQTLYPNASQMLIFKEHPTTRHYQGIEDPRDWMFPTVTGYHPSFFSYWKKCERHLKSMAQ